MHYEVTHTHNAGRVPVTVFATALKWDWNALPAVLHVTAPRVGDGKPLHAVVPTDRVVRVERHDSERVTLEFSRDDNQ